MCPCLIQWLRLLKVVYVISLDQPSGIVDSLDFTELMDKTEYYWSFKCFPALTGEILPKES